MLMNKRRAKKWFMFTALSHHGQYYSWGGDDPSGFDCSGLIVESLKVTGFLKHESLDFTADGLYNLMKEYITLEPREGAIVFYFNKDDKATHTGICLDEEYCISADGGGKKTKTKADAIRDNAFIKIRPIDKRKEARRYVYIF